MAKLYFYYSAMNAGKSTTLLQSAHNYHERGMKTLLFTPQLDDRYKVGEITSRIGLSAEAVAFDGDTDLFEHISRVHEPTRLRPDRRSPVSVRAQVLQVTLVCDELDIPVLCYGLRTDFQESLLRK